VLFGIKVVLVVTSYSVALPLASSTYTCSRHLLLLTDVENSNTYIVLEEQARNCAISSVINRQSRVCERVSPSP
jgi:hypothetical protein